MEPLHRLVPDSTTGISKDLKSDIVSDSVEDADELFVIAKDRLLKVNKWKELCPDFAELQLTDSHGNEMRRNAHYNDYIKINEPGRATEWVHIDGIEYNDFPDEDYETMAIRMRDAKQPSEYHDEDESDAHNKASGTIVVERRGRHITAHYYSRNENTIAATWLDGHDAQWQALVEALLSIYKIED